MKKPNPFRQAEYLLGAAQLVQLPTNGGIEVAFAGRSNAGKSSALNTLCEQKSLARTSKTPGRTQLINIFTLDEQRRLIDLPGYGFAKVSLEVKERWQKTLSEYLQTRQCLRGLILLSDIRHPLKETDIQMLQWAATIELPTHVLLSKSDKLKQGARKSTVLSVRRDMKSLHPNATCQSFSSLKREGMEQLLDVLVKWFEYESNETGTE